MTFSAPAWRAHRAMLTHLLDQAEQQVTQGHTAVAADLLADGQERLQQMRELLP